jgi:PKD repeat protein
MKRQIPIRLAGLLFLLTLLAGSCKKENDPLVITYSPSQPVANGSIQFTSSQSGGNWQYSWNFGDGHTNSTNNPSTTHTYTVAGTYNVQLNIYVGGNPSGMATISVTVQ